MSNADVPSAAPLANVDHVAEAIERHFDVAAGELQIGGLPVGELATRYGTPLFVYDHATLVRQWQALRDTLPAQFEICYSVKANPTQAILQAFVERDCGLEIASSGELCQALAAGCDPERILFAGPGKTEEELAAALEAGIGEIHVESLREAQCIARLARQRQRPATISLRVNPSAECAGASMRMGGRAAPFGIDEDQLAVVVEAIAGDPWLDVAGLHLFVGTQILDYQALLAHYRSGLDVARRLAALLRQPLKTIDFGGGWGVPYFAHERRLDLQRLAPGLDELAASIAADEALCHARLIVEPGRFLAAEAGIYVCRVSDVKHSRGKTFIITDGGMHHHLAASGNLGQTIKRNFPVAVLNKLNASDVEQADVVGPLCTPLDVLARAARLARAEPGDLIGVFQSGAYARSASPLGFLSRRSPPEVLVRDGADRLVRRRAADQDFLADQFCGSSTCAVP
jgi:diaminopimelate decarboxylase